VALTATPCLDPLMLPWMRREPASVHATDVHCVGGGILATDVTHCDVVLLRGRRAHVGMTTVNRSF